MRIGLTNDHRGYNSKVFLTKYLGELGYDVVDYGAPSEEPVDFPDYAIKLGKGIQNKEVDYGVAICGTGIGMSICLNKMHDVVCAKVSTVSEAMLSRSHNNANCISMSEDVSEELLKDIVHKFIDTPFANMEKYIRRNNKIKAIEND